MTERQTKLAFGGASDVGQVRSVNQDSILIGPDRFIVADGMGGHQGGEVASATAIETVAAADLATTEAGPRVLDLITAVQDANKAVFDRGTHNPQLAGMGTTLVGIALVVEDGEERLAIVNVGDSRAYRLSAGDLDQITNDHSLVAELVREGRITAEEAERHPQRNIVTRALGIDTTTMVDDFQILPRTGDRYLLCSDGLTNEVAERDIATVLRTIADPDEAAAELIRQANEHGGRDNITVLIVDVVDDGGLAAAASAAIVPDADDFHHDTSTDTQTLLALPDDRAHDDRAHDDQAQPDANPDATPARPRSAPAAAHPDTSAPAAKQRAITGRVVAFVVLIAAIVGVGAYLVNDYATNTYFVTVDDTDVVIFQGRPGGVLWFDPSLVEVAPVARDDVPATAIDDLEAGVTRPDLASARRYVDNLAAQIAEITPPVTTSTTTVADPTTPSSLFPPTLPNVSPAGGASPTTTPPDPVTTTIQSAG